MQIDYSFKAVRQLENLSMTNQKRIAKKMRFFASQSNIFPFAKYITTRGAYRLRIGDYRIYFEIRDNKLIVRTIERRDKAYD